MAVVDNMETRDILDYLGNVVGRLTLPEDTPEENWTAATQIYSQPPPSLGDRVSYKIESYEAMAPGIIRSIKTANTLAGITPAQSAQVMRDYGDVVQMIREGMLPTALYALKQKSPSGFITQEMLDSWIMQIQALL